MEGRMKEITIGKLSKQSRVSIDTLRYYEKLGLLKAQRTGSGYRLYDENALKTVNFILGAKSLNFTLDEIRDLLTVTSSNRATCAEMAQWAEVKIKEAEKKIRELKEIKRVLQSLADACPSDATPVEACPILSHMKKEKK